MRGAAPIDRSDYDVPKMDCPSEERHIRMALQDVSAVRGLSFDLPARRLVVWHAPGAVDAITERLTPLGFGARWVETRTGPAAADGMPAEAAGEAAEARTLWVLLAINAVMFVVELVFGLIVQSTGLLADSLDMFADAAVYGLSLYAVGRAAAHKLRAAHASGVLQLLLALGALIEVVRRTLLGSEPEPRWMMGVSLLALVANVACLLLVARHREGGAHMKASYIFSTNDVLANVGVIVAGGLVAWTGSRIPDLIVGAIIGLLVLYGAVRILRLR